MWTEQSLEQRAQLGKDVAPLDQRGHKETLGGDSIVAR
jgi:hypothetical protein